MDAEFIVVSGPLLGARFPLGDREVSIGHAPSAHIRLEEPGIAPEHCVVRPSTGGYRLTDRRSPSGTYINGMRVTEQALEPGDQVAIGEIVLLYREDAPPAADSTARHTLLRACSMLFLFRALASAKDPAQRADFEARIGSLLADIIPSTASAILMGRDEEELRAAARLHTDPAEMEALATAVSREGAVVDAAVGLVAIPLSTAGVPAGLLAAWFPAEEMPNLGEHRDTLGAVATLAAAAFESLRDVERLRTENFLLRERLGTAETGIAGESIAIHKMLGLIARVAPQDTSVLILGESGAGKELVASALHRLSPPRRQALRRHQLRRPHRDTTGKRAVRTREGSLHRSRLAEEGQARDGRRRHRLSRRDRRAGAAAASQASARPAAARVRTRGRHTLPGSSMSAWWPPPIATSRRRCSAAPSAWISTTA